MIQAMYVIGLLILLLVIYFMMPEMTISSASGSEGFINIPKPVALPQVKEIASSEASSSLPSAPFYGISDDRPRAPIDPSNEPVSSERMQRLLQRLEGFFIADYKAVENRVEYVGPFASAKAMLPRLREEINLVNANPGMSPTLSGKQIMESEANIAFLERKAREVMTNEVEAYTNFQEKRTARRKNIAAIEGFLANVGKTRASVKDLVEFNLRAWSEMQRLGASGTTDPIINARINAIKKIRQSIQRTIDDVKEKKIAPEDIEIFKDDLERAFPVLTDSTKPLPKILEAFSLPSELANLVSPGKDLSEDEIEELIGVYVNKILQGTSVNFNMKFQYTAPNEVRVEEAKAVQAIKGGTTFEAFSSKPKMNLTFSTKEGYETDEVNVAANDTDPLTKHSKYNPSLDWKGRTKQICEQVRMRGLDPLDFGCLKESDEVSPNYSWRGHAKMVCSRLASTPDPALPETCGCPTANWSGWNSDFSLDEPTPRLK